MSKHSLYYTGSKIFVGVSLNSAVIIPVYRIYPTPPLGQDMTQGQFLSGV